MLLRASLGLFLLATPGPSVPVAIVYSVQGPALVTFAGTRTTLHLFQWLPASARIEVGDEGSVRLAFADGARYAFSARSAALVEVKGLTAITGPVSRLPPVPPLPQIPELVDKESLGSEAGAIRVRGSVIEGLCPTGGMVTLANNTTLSFTPLAGRRQYTITVSDESGRAVFTADTAVATIDLPNGTLAAGRRYRWRVETVGSGPVASGDAAFVTLAHDLEERRAVFKAGLTDAEDDRLSALLAVVDRQLGLLIEAREELREAVARDPGDLGLREALADVQRRLGSPRRASS